MKQLMLLKAAGQMSSKVLKGVWLQAWRVHCSSTITVVEMRPSKHLRMGQLKARAAGTVNLDSWWGKYVWQPYWMAKVAVQRRLRARKLAVRRTPVEA
jgi:hypothetical protein